MSVLTNDQIDNFINYGFVTLHNCFTREQAAPLIEQAWKRLGYDPCDQSTWTKGRIHMPTTKVFPVEEFAPTAYAAACELCGGAERMQQPFVFGDGFIVNLNDGADKPWNPPSQDQGGWHKDGDFFRHFLDSPEQGLLTLVVWSDIDHQGGATFGACDSVSVVARYFADHPEGVLPNDTPFMQMIKRCTDIREFTGKCGDVVLMHPYMLHAGSQNMLRVPRFLTNPPDSLDRADELQPRKSGGFLAGRVGDSARAGCRASRILWRLRRVKKWCRSEFVYSSGCASKRRSGWQQLPEQFEAESFDSRSMQLRTQIDRVTGGVRCFENW